MENPTNEICRLCGNKSLPFYKAEFYQCSSCNGISRNSSSLPSPEKEKLRYDQHKNSPDDGYSDFISPLLNYVRRNISKEKKGLDFGCGPKSILTQTLSESHYLIEKYDPFYENNLSLLQQKFDFIAACEVVEHFHHPAMEFRKLKAMLLNKGELLLMTHLFDHSINFDKWYYKNDFTHVFFYTKESFEWIKNHYNFSELEINGRFIRLKN